MTTSTDLTEGLCTNAPPEIWFDQGTVAQAIQICSNCPVQPACLRLALDRGEEFGVWGGTTPSDRTRRLQLLRRVSA